MNDSLWWVLLFLMWNQHPELFPTLDQYIYRCMKCGDAYIDKDPTALPSNCEYCGGPLIEVGAPHIY